MTFWPGWAAVMLNAAAAMLAFGFRRNRAVMVLAILTLCALAVTGDAVVSGHARGPEALRMFAPWLLFAAVLMPERGLFARSSLALLLAAALVSWLTLAASGVVWDFLRQALPLGLLPWSVGSLACALVLLAASLCVLRWVLLGAPIQAGLAVVLGLAAIAMLPSAQIRISASALAAAGAVALVAVLYALYRMAFMDALAGLPNRRALDETLSRLSGNYALAMVDVDHFKRFNDTHGHAAGDRVVRSVAQQLRRTRGCRAYRYGGEEFCLLFAGSGVRNAARVCEDLRRRIEAMRVRVRASTSPRRGQAVKRTPPGEAKVTVSIGLALRDADARLPSDVLKAADQALYRAKSKGRNRVVKP